MWRHRSMATRNSGAAFGSSPWSCTRTSSTASTAAGEPAQIEDLTLAYVDRGKRSRDIADVQSSSDALAEAKRLLGSPTTDQASQEKTGSSYSLHQVWERYRQRRQPAASDEGVA